MEGHTGTIVASDRLIGKEELYAPHVFVTTMASHPNLKEDLGYITVMALSKRNPYQKFHIKNFVDEAEARAVAVAKLREKCTAMGGNAVLNLKIDVEKDDRLFATLVNAQGSAVVLSPAVIPVVAPRPPSQPLMGTESM